MGEKRRNKIDFNNKKFVDEMVKSKALKAYVLNLMWMQYFKLSAHQAFTSILTFIQEDHQRWLYGGLHFQLQLIYCFKNMY